MCCWTSAVILFALLAIAPLLRAADQEYVAHEWGTFTSIQGGDGVPLNWNGIATAELPSFVYDWSKPGLQRFSTAFVAKGGLYCLQRMETPVIYFYAKQPLNVDVAVRFPQGQITEWFPQTAEIGPSAHQPSLVLTSLDSAANDIGLHPNPSLATRFGEPPITNSIIHWKDFEVLPAKQHSDLAGQLPTATKASHYFAARETEAAYVRVDSMEPTNHAPEIEKFLFYRGVGNFPTPLKVTMNEQGEITLLNTGNQPLKHLFALAIQGDRAAVVPLGQLDAGQTHVAHLNTSGADKRADVALPQASRQLADALVAEGLYRAEAEAMVKTWRDAWFEDQGVRVLYILPRAWTDTTLPITMAPQPSKLVRVMVGRAELISPAMEQQVRNCVEDFRQSDPAAKAAAVSKFQAMRLGRFAQVALRLAASHSTDKQFTETGTALIEAATKAAPTSASTSQPAGRLPATGG